MRNFTFGKFLLVIVLTILGSVLLSTYVTYSSIQRPVELAIEQIDQPIHKESYVIENNDSIFNILYGKGVDGTHIIEFVEGAKDSYDLRKIMPGKTIKLNINDAHLHYFEYQIDELSTFISTWTPESGFNYEIKKVEHRVELFTARGEVDGGIYFAAIEAGLDPGAVIRLADIYAWDIDFNRELQAGDKFSILIEKIYIGEQFIRFGHILAATVEVDGIAHRAIYFTDKSGKEGYFDEQGHSLQRSFLRRPLPFGRVTCGFNPRRFHPVLKRRMPHYGVDFGAPIGTPVYAVGDGVITKTGYDKANGKYIKMRHNSVYSSAYCHLSRIKPGIKSGRRVKQGQTIGYVGKTGLATGPHLHLAFYRNGSYVNYLRVKFPSLGGIQKQDEERFAIVKDYSLRATEIN